MPSRYTRLWRVLPFAIMRFNMVPRAGLEPACPFERGIFLPLRLSPPFVCGLDYTFTVAYALGARRLVSTRS